MFPLRPPFFGYPFNNFYINNRRSPYSTYSISNCKNSRNNLIYTDSSFNATSSSVNEKDSRNESFDDYFFEIFGLKLYFDDILIICLLFFLYEEGVNDQELFISLILLLLS